MVDARKKYLQMFTMSKTPGMLNLTKGHTTAALGPPGGVRTPYVHFMHDRWSVGVPPLAPPLPTLVAVAYRSLPRLAPRGGGGSASSLCLSLT